MLLGLMTVLTWLLTVELYRMKTSLSNYIFFNLLCFLSQSLKFCVFDYLYNIVPSSSSIPRLLNPLSSRSPAGAPQACLQSVAVPGGGADPDGLHDVGRLEVWAGQRARLQKAPHRTALDCGLDSRCCWPFYLDPLAWALGPDLSPVNCTPKITLGLPDCIS